MDTIATLVALAVLAMPVSTAGVVLLDQWPHAGSTMMWTGIGTIVAVEFLLPFMLL